MKRFTLFAAGILAIMSGYAAEKTPVFFTEDFYDMSVAGDYVTDDWTTYGIGVAAGEEYLQAGYPADGPAYVLWQVGSTALACANTMFSPSQAADQWLITPAIEIPADDVELGFTAGDICYAGAWGTNTCPFKVLISETGVAKEDFSETPILEGSIKGSVTTDLRTSNFLTPISGYKGKKVHLAFVVTGQDAGVVGFTNIRLGNYLISFQNVTTKISEKGQSVVVDVNVGLKTPVTCSGFTAVLDVKGNTSTLTTSKPVGKPSGSSLIYDEVKFSDFPINLTTSETVEYKVTVTPNYEGAVSSELTGSIAVPQEDYLNNVVVEELTATGCTYCPSGMAAMEYYSENYKGSEDEGKFIGIALHGAINYQDPMGTDIMNSYVTPFMDSNSYTSYPQARFNRATTAKQPTDLSSFTSQLIQPTYTETKISSVVTPSANVQAGDEIKVYFDTKMGYDINDIDLNAAVVLVENDVQGNSTDYSQTNYFATTDESFITQNYGAWLLPYMQVYLNSPSTIRFDQIKYQHVARGIFPQFDGTPLPFKDFKWGESRRAMLSFNLPESVMNWENTEVVVMILDVESGKIVASDICSAANYDTTSVKNVASSATKINREGNNISIKAEDGSAVSVYSVDGSLLGSYVVENGNLYVDGSSFNGVVIVRVNGVNEVNTAKLLF